MNWKQFVRKHFQTEIRENQTITGELRAKLLKGSHPNVEKFLDNMARSLQQDAISKNRLGKQRKETDQIWSVREMTKVFIHMIEQEARKMYQKESERLAEQRKAIDEADMEATLAGKPQGAFEEMGLTIEDKSQTTI
jgi:hypothetical protein